MCFLRTFPNLLPGRNITIWIQPSLIVISLRNIDYTTRHILPSEKLPSKQGGAVSTETKKVSLLYVRRSHQITGYWNWQKLATVYETL